MELTAIEWIRRLKVYGYDWAVMESIWHGGMSECYKRLGMKHASEISSGLALLAMEVAKMELEGIATNAEAACELARRTDEFYIPESKATEK